MAGKRSILIIVPGRHVYVMHREKTEIYCSECGTWLIIEDPEGPVACECGSEFSITVTPYPDSRPEADRTPSPRGHPVRRELRQKVELQR